MPLDEFTYTEREKEIHLRGYEMGARDAFIKSSKHSNIKVSYAGSKLNHLEPIDLPDDHFDRPTENPND